ncbi:MAG: preprotein translocase subunit SecY [Ruminococcaceae bacterium]|nr:preprotein translocase subunit SecY [Oscillospiraceae bacterium]
MLQTIVNAWKIADLRKKLIYTALIVLVFRIGSAIPVPFTAIAETGVLGANATTGNTFLNYLNMMTGDAFNYGTIFAMSITPYINSSIIMQLLAVAIPALERLQKEGEEGRKKIAAITRFVTIALGVLQSTAYFFYLRSQGYLTKNAAGADFTGFAAVFQALVVILCFTAGTALIMWLGERINEKGIGNGISIILFAGIVSRIPSLISSLLGPSTGYISRGGAYIPITLIITVVLVLMIAFIVWMDSAERRIPVQYAKRVVGRKMYGGQSTHIPLKVNMSGVMPVIFASSILSLPPTIKMFMNPSTVSENKALAGFFSIFEMDHWVYSIIYFVFIIAFAYFYASIQYNPIEMSKNIRDNGGSIPGIRPGEPTSRYIGKIIHRITLLGALLLSVVALLPIIYSQVATFILEKLGYAQGFTVSLGGTSIIILVGVALETVKQLESQMMMRHYKGFLD